MSSSINMDKLVSKISPENIKIAILIALLFILFIPVLMILINVWNTNDDYSHGFFVIPIFIYMLWQKRDMLSEAQANPTWFGMLLLLIGILLYCFCYAIKFHTMGYISIIIIVFSMVLYLSGFRIAGQLLFPILFLAFMFPIPSSYYIKLTSPLKLFISNVSAVSINFVGISVYQEGNLLYFANTQLEVAEACSGIRSLLSYTMLGCIFSFFCSTLPRKIILIFSAFPLAILVNIIRVTGTGILSHFYGEKAAQGFFHEFTGFFLFFVGLIFLFGEYYILEEWKKKDEVTV